jgi:hypothetical protein
MLGRDAITSLQGVADNHVYPNRQRSLIQNHLDKALGCRVIDVCQSLEADLNDAVGCNDHEPENGAF